jgi:hypothetical protein
MIFDKLDRLMPNTVDFTDSDIDSTTLGSDFSINIVSDLGYSASYLC